VEWFTPGGVVIYTHTANNLSEGGKSKFVCGGYSKCILNMSGENFVEKGMKMTDNFKTNLEPQFVSSE
jgi:hypothetical protein